MTRRDEDTPRVLIFADILGFEQMTREIRVRVEDYRADESGITGSGTTELQGRFVRFSNVLDRHVFEETGYGQDSDRAKTTEAGFHVHLVKPIDLDTLDHVLTSSA